MGAPAGRILSHILHLIAFLPFFAVLFLLGILKVVVFGPFVFIIILAGNLALIYGLYPVHVIWTCYCVFRTKKFGELLKVIILLLIPIPIVLWLPVATVGSILAALGFAIASPLMATFAAVREGVINKLDRCLKDGTWSSIKAACTVVRDFKDMCFHSYISVMDGLLEARDETLMNIKLAQVPGCMLAAIVGVFIDVPMLSLIVLYKVPVMLFKGWKQLICDLMGRSGPFLESVCVPFAGLMILLWPIAVVLTAAAGILSSLSFGLYAAAIVYQENSTVSGVIYAIACISIFDEFTNDFLYMREGSCFPRPKYRKAVLSHSPSLPVRRLPEQSGLPLNYPPIKTPSMKMQELKAVVIWENFFMACEYLGKDLVKDGAIQLSDLEAWHHAKSKMVTIGLPSYVFLQCFIHSIKCGSTGFVMRDNVELTSVNRPEGRVFDWLFEPMLLLKEQIKAANLSETEEAYLNKLSLYCGDTQIIAAWENGGVPPVDEVKRAQLEGLSRRLHGFSLTLSRMPTFRRRFEEVVKVLLQEARQMSEHNANGIAQAT